jgi:hypothetical protein
VITSIPPDLTPIEEEMRQARKDFYNAAEVYGAALDKFIQALRKGNAELLASDKPHAMMENDLAYYDDRIKGAGNHKSWIRGVLSYFTETDRGSSWW